VDSAQVDDDWVALSEDHLSLDTATAWVARPDCGAIVAFAGMVRDHADGRSGVSRLEYEAYTEQIVPRLRALVGEARARWSLGRVVCWHRVGVLGVGDCAVVVAVSSAHRAEAFDAARWCIDTVKATMPIWKHETWDGGDGWGSDAHQIHEVAAAPSDPTAVGP
jgi:molybdopterin synthase catalytic subunit